MNQPEDRRAFLAIAGAGVLLAACRKEASVAQQPATHAARALPSATQGTAEPSGAEEQVSATEDLMREHGVIRRVLIVYREAATRLRTKPGDVPADALQRAAKLLRSFGEDYHEKQLEEALLFPQLTKRGGPLVAAVNTLIAQHQRGRELTERVLALTGKASNARDAQALATMLESFARMYEAHAAFEDTVVFPAWKKTLSPKEFAEMGERFEDIEHKAFAKDGFDDAVEQVASVEKSFGMDLGGFTAPPAP